MERLSTEDQIMLWPDARWPQEIGAIAVLDGRSLLDGNGAVRIGLVRAAIASRLHLVPRFRQVLHTPRRGLGGPLWVDASDFDIAEHVRVVALPAPADEEALLTAVEGLRRVRLDRSRPLWQICLLPGLHDRRIGLFVRIHHAVADGIAGIATIGALLDAAPGSPPVAVPAPPWRPSPAPTELALFSDNLRRRADRVGRTLYALARPVAMARRLRAGWPMMRELLGAQPAPPTSLNRLIGDDRILVLIRTTLDEVTEIAHRYGASVNDVLLTIAAGGVRALLTSRGETVDDRVVRIDVPITLRAAATRTQARGNLIGQMIVAVPIGVADPVNRLAQISAYTAVRKATQHTSVGVVLRSRLVRRILVKLLDRQPVNVTSADLPGPTQPLYLAGARLLEVFPVLPLMANVSVGVGALSYAGQFNIGAIGDRAAHPDLAVFAAGVRDDLAVLQAARLVGAGITSEARGDQVPERELIRLGRPQTANLGHP